MKSFVYKTKIHLRDTDATGVLYFADQFRLALEAFEAFLMASGIPLRQILERESFFLPVVHAEGDYFAPLMVDDPLEITFSVSRVGTSSITCQYDFFEPIRKIAVGKVSLVHVTVSKETRTSIPLPEPLHTLFQSL